MTTPLPFHSAFPVAHVDDPLGGRSADGGHRGHWSKLCGDVGGLVFRNGDLIQRYSLGQSYMGIYVHQQRIWSIFCRVSGWLAMFWWNWWLGYIVFYRNDLIMAHYSWIYYDTYITIYINIYTSNGMNGTSCFFKDIYSEIHSNTMGWKEFVHPNLGWVV